MSEVIKIAITVPYLEKFLNKIFLKITSSKTGGKTQTKINIDIKLKTENSGNDGSVTFNPIFFANSKTIPFMLDNPKSIPKEINTVAITLFVDGFSHSKI